MSTSFLWKTTEGRLYSAKFFNDNSYLNRECTKPKIFNSYMWIYFGYTTNFRLQHQYSGFDDTGKIRVVFGISIIAAYIIPCEFLLLIDLRNWMLRVFFGMVDSSEANGIRIGTCVRNLFFDSSDMNVSNFNSTISKRMRVTNFGQRSNILNNKSCTGAQEFPSVRYQWPIRTALRNTWRPIRTVTFVEPLPFLRRFHRRERAEVHVHNTTPRWHVNS